MSRMFLFPGKCYRWKPWQMFFSDLLSIKTSLCLFVSIWILVRLLSDVPVEFPVLSLRAVSLPTRLLNWGIPSKAWRLRLNSSWSRMMIEVSAEDVCRHTYKSSRGLDCNKRDWAKEPRSFGDDDFWKLALFEGASVDESQWSLWMIFTRGQRSEGGDDIMLFTIGFTVEPKNKRWLYFEPFIDDWLMCCPWCSRTCCHRYLQIPHDNKWNDSVVCFPVTHVTHFDKIHT